MSWLIQVWDTAGDATVLDGTEARCLGSVLPDVGINQGIMRRPKPLTLWARLLTSLKEKYLCQEDLQLQQGPWNTMEQGIQCLQELAVMEILFSNDDQTIKSPVLVKRTTLIRLKLTPRRPSILPLPKDAAME